MENERGQRPAVEENAGHGQETGDGREADYVAAYTDANYTDAFDAPDRQGVMGPDNGPQHRAAPGEGVRAPFAQDTGGDAQFSVFDGKGNESVVVLAEDENGRPSQGSGPDTASARKEATKGKADPGSAFGNL